MSVINKRRISEDLKQLGLQAGDIVLVHSSLSSLGRVEGGAKAMIEALLEVLTPAGTLLMPSFNWAQPYDPSLPTSMGAIAEVFRTWPGVVRGFHATHPANALGPRAQDLLKDHMAGNTAAGPHSPFGKLIEIGGKILLLGVDNDRNTVLHCLEEEVEAPYLGEMQASYYDSARNVQTLSLRLYPGPHRDFISLDPLLRRSGAEVVGTVGRAVSRLIDARTMHDTVLAAFRENPALMLCDNPNCADCVAQRRSLRLARLREESFTLSALASAVSPYPDEIASELARAGVYDVVLDRLYGQPVWLLPPAKLRRAAAAFADEGVSIGAVVCPPDSAAFTDYLDRLEPLGNATAIVPFPPDPAAFIKIADARGRGVLFENENLPSAVCLRLLQGLDAGIAFNPAAFARGGEQPFLWVISKTQIRKYIGLLFLSDATFGGEYTLPGRGNAEVKEVLSILRCRSFAGRVVIATGPGGPGFRELVEGFWRVLEGS